MGNSGENKENMVNHENNSKENEEVLIFYYLL